MIVRFTSFLLIFALLSTSFTRLVFYAGYALNKDYIAKVLCENKAKPLMKCQGKCYLNKKIKQAEEKDQKQGSRVTKSNLEVFINTGLDFRCFIFQTDEFLACPLFSYSLFVIYKIFQPPRF